MSKLNSKPIDIVIPWVNPNDKNWQKDFTYWKQKESGQKDPCRFRDMGIFNFWFRCIEQNMQWVRYIFLILANETQIPSWLNDNHPKLKIVYHSEFIPASELPTFNSSVINCFVPFIKEVSSNYILFNDDFFVIKPIEEREFFINDIPVANFRMSKCPTPSGAPWYYNLANNCKLMENITKRKDHFLPDHGPIAFDKNIQLFIWYKAKKELESGLEKSKFRQNKNFTDWIFFDAQGQLKRLKKLNTPIVQYVNKPNVQYRQKIICVNDNELLTDTSFDEFTKDTITKLSGFKKSRFER